jgi:nickel/cobalt transporter (NicO) family protein
VTRDAKARLVLSVLLVALITAGFCQEAAAQSSPLAAMRQPAATGFVGWLLSKQALFYRELSGLIRAAKSDGTALWGLMGISFAYGIFHAAGPGHGKAVISSYLVANEETWRRGVTLSFASAFLQALTAVVLVAVAAIVIGATAKAMGDTVRVIETISYWRS